MQSNKFPSSGKNVQFVEWFMSNHFSGCGEMIFSEKRPVAFKGDL